MWSNSKILLPLINLVSIFTRTHGNYTRTVRQTRDNSCVLPPHPEFGRWTIYDVSSQLPPGKPVPSRTVLELSCQDNYKIDGQESTSCIRGKWQPDLGKCLRTCPVINGTSIMTVTCSLNEKTLDSCENAFDGTIARFQCVRYYEDEAQERDPFRLCSDGKWVGSLPRCVPICGKSASQDDPTLIIGGTKAKQGEYPWQAAIYNTSNKALLCGGTLLNQRVIVTAAHCITDSVGNLAAKELYTIAMGKYFRQYDHPDDKEKAQFSSIYEMYIPRQYKADRQHYFGDVGIIVTTKIFDLSSTVRPVCVIWKSGRHQALTNSTRRRHAYVSGWGYTAEYERPSSVLKRLKVPLITEAECNDKMTEDDTDFLTDDKLCAGFLNSSKSVCKGDSGGGLVTKYKGRYYIIGIVSISPKGYGEEGGCNSQLYTMYTSFSYYIDSFILEKEARFRPRIDCLDDPNCAGDLSPTTITTTTTTESSSSYCTVPTHLKSAKWTILNNPNKSSYVEPGATVASGTVLKMECGQNFQLEGQSVTFCYHGQWSSEFGECLKICPARVSTPLMNVTCSYNGTEIENCSRPVEGTVATFRCAPFYEDAQLIRRPTHICRDGTWDQPLPECVPACGQRLVSTRAGAHPSNTTFPYPWHVSIYSKSGQLICSGSLVSQRIILTVAHCVADDRGQLHPKEDYTVAVGNKYKNISDVRNIQAQQSGLHEIFVPPQYRGNVQNYLGDIAVLITEKTFTLSEVVQPVCLDVNANNKFVGQEYGTMSMWHLLQPNSSDILKKRTIQIFSESKCLQEVPEDFEIYLTYDKMCGTSLNGTGCQSESGAGLVFEHLKRYYIVGVASLSPVAQTVPIDGVRSCENLVMYTDVSKYLNAFIVPKLVAYKT